MASPNLLSGTVMNMAAARLNDANRQVYTYDVQLPFLNIALAELQELYEANNVPVTDTTSIVIPVNASLTPVTTIPFNITGVDPPPTLPDNLIEIKVLWESPRNLNQWSMMKRLDFLPQYELGQQIGQFIFYQWASNEIKVLSANADNDLKIDYVRSLFVEVDDEDAELLVINSASYLWNRTASLMAHDIEENNQRSNELYVDALGGLDRSLTITTKGRQRITTRRRPFRAAYKANRSGY